jgi:hypothetical protein
MKIHRTGSKVISGGHTHRQAGYLKSPLSFSESRLKVHVTGLSRSRDEAVSSADGGIGL